MESLFITCSWPRALKRRLEGLDDARLGPAVINQQLVAAAQEMHHHGQFANAARA